MNRNALIWAYITATYSQAWLMSETRWFVVQEHTTKFEDLEGFLLEVKLKAQRQRREIVNEDEMYLGNETEVQAEYRREQRKVKKQKIADEEREQKRRNELEQYYYET